RRVEVGRLVLLNNGPSAGQLAVIVEIIDHKRVLIDSPDTTVARQSFPLAHVSLTSIVIPSLPRGARTAIVSKIWENQSIDEQWSNSAFAKRINSNNRRSALNDFDRFKVMVLRKQRRFEVRKAL
ncbi:ribosomal protein L14-domain-containing protein, partial [Trichophaea hybrida]